MSDAVAKPKVLLVEDNLEILEMLALLLGRFFQVTTAINGREALKLAKQDPPDLAILDVNVPIIDGFSVCKLLKDDAETRHAKVIILTAAYNDEAGRQTSMAAGADAFFMKPVKSAMLIDKAHGLLGLPSPIKA